MPLKLHAALNPGVRRRELFGWAMYDFANSAYTTIVITTVYSAYFVAVVCDNARWGTLAWTTVLSLSYLLIILTAPALGAYADQRGAKKQVLLWLTVGCVLGTAALMLTGPGTVLLALVLILVSNWCFGSGENVTAAFLPELARPEAMGKVSGFSWSLGYLGGLVALAACIGWLQVMPGPWGIPGTLAITAVFFALGSLCTFVWLKERAPAHPAGAQRFGTLVKDSLRQTLVSLRGLRDFPELKQLLWCILAFQAGIMTVITLAAIYASQALGFSTEQTLLMIAVVNITAAVGAFGFGFVQDALGHRRALALCLASWILTIALLAIGTSSTAFWIAANLAGLNLGAAQSAGRAMVGYLAPPARTGEFFGLWGLSVKAASILGPLTYGLLSYLSNNNHRLAMLATGVFFVAGLLVLRTLDMARGRARVAGLGPA